MAAVIEAESITVRYGGLKALDDVSFAVGPGEIVGVVGPNGSGKTTLFNVLSGLRRPNAGSVRIDGRDVTTESVKDRARLGLSRTFQLAQLFPELTVREHVLLPYRISRNGVSVCRDLLAGGGDRSGEDAAVDELLDQLGLGGVAYTRALNLPLSTGRLVEIARALATDPKVLLLDEPSSGLNRSEKDMVVGVLERAHRARAVSLVVVEHDFEFILQLADRIDVLDFGRKIASGSPSVVRADPAVVEAYIGGTRDDRSRETGGLRRRSVGTQVALSLATTESSVPSGLILTGVSAGYGRVPVVAGVDLELPQGRVLTVLGPNGAGKSTLAGVISGLVRTSAGEIAFNGTDVTAMPPHGRAALGIAHSVEARGAFPRLTVSENLEISLRRIRREMRGSTLEEIFELFPALKDRHKQLAGTLSGGERQMLALARVIGAQPKLIIADEPSLGLAPRLVDTIFEAIARIASTGVSILLIEQYAHNALAIADEALILKRGTIAWSGSASSASDALLTHYLGVDEDESRLSDSKHAI